MDLCREKGVVRFHKTDTSLEMVFGPLVTAAEAKKKEATTKDPQAGRREHYESMLNRNVSDQELEMLP